MISDDDLLLYHYRDGLEPDERARIGAAVSKDPQLAQRLQSLVARSNAIGYIKKTGNPLSLVSQVKAFLTSRNAGA